MGSICICIESDSTPIKTHEKHNKDEEKLNLIETTCNTDIGSPIIDPLAIYDLGEDYKLPLELIVDYEKDMPVFILIT